MDNITFNAEILKRRGEHPDLQQQIDDFFELCQDEIEAGESPFNERQKCISSIDELIQNQK